MSVPENVEEAAYLAADVKEILHAEMVMSTAALSNFDTRQAHMQESIRAMSGTLDAAVDEDIQGTANSVQAFHQASEYLQELGRYYANALGDISSHLSNVDGYSEAKEKAETLAAAAMNVQADFNQALAIIELEKQIYMSARLNYEERVRTAIEKAKAAYKEGADNALKANGAIDELVQLAESLAM